MSEVDMQDNDKQDENLGESSAANLSALLGLYWGEIYEYLNHDDSICGGRHQKCNCGLNDLTDRLGVKRVYFQNVT